MELTFVLVQQSFHYKRMLAGLVGASNSEADSKAQAFLDMGLLSSAVQKILKFNTEKEAFNTNYPKTDHLQRFFNEKALKHFVEVITNKYNTDKQPLSILDFCCGYGFPTFNLRQLLTANGVEIAKLVGYDVSGDMIGWAQAHNPFFPQLVFEKKNLQTEFNEVAQYDVVICLFGLHWMNDLEPAVASIHRSLKPGGIFLSLTPIEIKDLFDFRTNFVNNSKWTVAIAESARVLHPFHYSKEDYLKPLSKYFSTTYEEKKETKFNYSRKEYITFLHSWLQEVRHLTNDVHHEVKKEAVANAYIGDFIDSIPKNLNGNVVIHEDGSVVYTQHTFDFDGRKLEL